MPSESTSEFYFGPEDWSTFAAADEVEGEMTLELDMEVDG